MSLSFSPPQHLTAEVRRLSGVKSVIRALLLVALCASGAFAQPGVLPRELQSIAQTVGCAPVPDFYSRDGPLDPPYAYGVLRGNRESSAAFWCVHPGDSSTRFVVVSEGRVAANVVWENSPDGMRVIELGQIDLEEWRRMDAWSTRGPHVRLTRVRAILSEWDGVETYFVERDGVWYFQIRH